MYLRVINQSCKNIDKATGVRIVMLSIPQIGNEAFFEDSLKSTASAVVDLIKMEDMSMILTKDMPFRIEVTK